MAKFLSYEKTNNFIDYSTGEITSKEETRTFKIEKNSEQFFKFFVNSIGNLYALSTASSFKVLFAILNKATDRENFVNLRYGMKSLICQNVGIHINSFSKSLNEIVDKGILKKVEDTKDCFILNPYIFGQGTFVDVERLRQRIEIDWDFKEGVMKRTIGADSVTSTGMHILENPQQYEVSDIKQEKNENNSNLSLSVRHKENNKGITPYPTELSLPIADNTIEETKAEELNNADNTTIQKHNDIDRLKYEAMIKSFEITSKMLDMIKDLRADGKKEEAMSLQKNMEQYLNNFSLNH